MRLLLIALALGVLVLPAQAQRETQVQTFQTSAGLVKITPIYHSTALIEGGGKVIYIDPAKPANFETFPAADLILITHEHSDHVDQDQTSIKKISKAGTQIWAPSAVSNFVTTATVISNGQTRTLEGWTVEAVPAYNMVRGSRQGQFFHPKGTGNGYVLNFGGTRFYFSGDTEGIPEMRALKNINVAFICMNLPYTMTVDEAAAVVKVFHPKIAIPYHYYARPLTDLSGFIHKLDGTGIEVRLLEWYPRENRLLYWKVWCFLFHCVI